ncbi:hypothetical protein GALMADRAFT_148306 [Galerina marginata CBS 339.88]|uniref:Uncharacterized protein n=1 Tax=Galerina marginata (strain CBS 339.88) TaxID=685588 RepID=A0A067SDY6_GALM3|nr:hypothetical protein GALMADRAFT_148306 [Galerina marginata CBS 339.88]
MDPPTFPVAFQKSMLNTTLNSSTPLTFLTGIYTMTYIGTLYVYLTRKGSQRRIIIGAISSLYFLSILDFGIECFIVQWVFVGHAETREAHFNAMIYYDMPVWVSIAADLANYPMLVIADGLLRCFHVWGRSIRAVVVPLFLLLVEIALFMFSTICTFIVRIERKQLPIVVTQSAGYFVSLAATLITTILVAYRIYSVSRQGGPNEGRFKRLIDILIQSGAAYSLALLVSGITTALTSSLPLQTLWALQTETEESESLQGISPTLMVARVCLTPIENGDLSTNVYRSALQFSGEPTSEASDSREN